MEEDRVQGCGNEGRRDSVDEDIDHGPYIDMDLGFPEEFEFRISVSRAPGVSNTIDLISHADELFYKGQLLPLHLPPRIEMVQNLVSLAGSEPEAEAEAAVDSLNSESFWSKDSTNSDSSCSTSSSGSSRDSSGSSAQYSECRDSRGGLVNGKEKTQFPSWRKSAAKWKGSLLNLRKSSKVGTDEKQINARPLKCNTLTELRQVPAALSRDSSRGTDSNMLENKSYHSLSFSDRFSSMDKDREKEAGSNNRSAKEVFQKYFKMIKPFYEKRSTHKHGLRMNEYEERTVKSAASQRPSQSSGRVFFSGTLKTGRRTSVVGSCPSSMRPSPNHSGVLVGAKVVSSSGSTMEELQNAIQGAIAHCKKSNAVTADSNADTAGDTAEPKTPTIAVAPFNYSQEPVQRTRTCAANITSC